MAKGRLEVTGTLPLSQFWPQGESDADSSKLLLQTGPESFHFQAHPGAPLQVTQAFFGATVRGRVTKPALTKGKLTVRLQGIDAPELHYMPTSLKKAKECTEEERALFLEWNHRYRQPLGEAATTHLARLLEGAGQGELPCRLVSHVDEPGEVFDAYGRFVGEVFVTLQGREVSINSWLCRQGWAFPAFYSSMSKAEIKKLLLASENARLKKLGVWGQLGAVVNRLDWDLRYRGKGAELAEGDEAGTVILPKLFRRLCAWAVNRRAKMVQGSFRRYLEERPEVCYLTKDFLAQGIAAATPRRFSEFVTEQGVFESLPQDLVFQEAASRLVGPGGRPVAWFPSSRIKHAA